MELSLTDRQFEELTLAEFDILCWQLEQRRMNDLHRPTALICMVIANCSRDPETKPDPYSVEDFLPCTPEIENARAKAEAQNQAKRNMTALWWVAFMTDGAVNLPEGIEYLG